ncbi:MAG: phosphate ABC transporter permease subunit PstC [Acidobacteriaceae bacterium]
MNLRIQEPRAPKPAEADRPVDGIVAVPVSDPASPIRTYLQSRGNSSVADSTFRWLMVLCALSIFAIVALIGTELVTQSIPTIKVFGWRFFVGSAWDPVNGHFGALPFIYGTIMSSVVALVIAVPLAVGVAVFLTEMCPKALRGILSFLTELLAAIPSVVYGLWGVFVLVPLLRGYVDPVLIKTLGWTGLFVAPDFGIGMFAAGVILAIMILPIISSLTREVMTAVPHMQREAVLALGATRWEMIRMGVLRNARIGIVGAIILGLGRALGETMAVAMVIGSSPTLTKSLLAPAYSMAAVIANEFTEAVSDLHRTALIEIGLALFLVTIVVNILARLLVWAVTRGAPARAA